MIALYIKIAVIILWTEACIAISIRQSNDMKRAQEKALAEREAMIALCKQAAEEEAPVLFNHGGSDIGPCLISEATEGVFYYILPGGGMRRASYIMVSNLEFA